MIPVSKFLHERVCVKCNIVLTMDEISNNYGVCPYCLDVSRAGSSFVATNIRFYRLYRIAPKWKFWDRRTVKIYKE
jgi:hypothetical protein